MPARQFVVDNFKANMLKGSLDLVNNAIKAALCASFSPNYSTWSADTVYSLGDIIIPTTRNGLRYRATNDGKTDTSEPTWPTTSGGTVTEDVINGVTWEEYGGEHADIEFFNEISGNEVIDGDGYTAGGATLSSKNITGGNGMLKITFMGAGSTIFAKNVIGDSLLTPALREAEFALYDIDEQRLKDSEMMLKNINNNHGNYGKINAYTDRRAAIKDADYVVNAIPLEVPLSKLPQKARKYIQYFNLSPPYFLCYIPVKYARLDEAKALSEQKTKDILEQYSTLLNEKNNIITELESMLYGSVDKFGQKASQWVQSFNVDNPKNSGVSGIIDKLRGK